MLEEFRIRDAARNPCGFEGRALYEKFQHVICRSAFALKGHGFSRAAEARQKELGLQPPAMHALRPEQTEKSANSMLVAAARVVGKVKSALELSTFSTTHFPGKGSPKGTTS
jgi:hypothetical protein